MGYRVIIMQANEPNQEIQHIEMQGNREYGLTTEVKEKTGYGFPPHWTPWLEADNREIGTTSKAFRIMNRSKVQRRIIHLGMDRQRPGRRSDM